MAYKLEFVDAATDDDITFESNGVTVFTDAKSLAYLDGTELDYSKEGLNEGFKFNNPNVKTNVVAAKASTSDRLLSFPEPGCHQRRPGCHPAVS
jgi:iron-sulfur cluster assembly accessory protein